jgi:hypothetical protein
MACPNDGYCGAERNAKRDDRRRRKTKPLRVAQ